METKHEEDIEVKEAFELALKRSKLRFYTNYIKVILLFSLIILCCIALKYDFKECFKYLVPMAVAYISVIQADAMGKREHKNAWKTCRLLMIAGYVVTFSLMSSISSIVIGAEGYEILAKVLHLVGAGLQIIGSTLVLGLSVWIVKSRDDSRDVESENED